MNRINIAKPWLGEEEIAALTAVVESGWVAQGPKVAEFEERFADRTGASHAVAVSSCTTALHLALIVAGIGAGDDVVVPSFSFIATTNAPMYVGANPVFADIDPANGNLTPATIEAVLTPATKAVILVHQAGMPADIDAVRALCDPLGIAVIEDAACAIGATYHGRPIGERAQIAAWSFHPRKLITTGEGGMLTTESAEWASRARRLREHAMSVSATARHQDTLPPAEQFLEVGYNYRMTDLQAAIGLVQLGRLESMIARRREIAADYAAAFADVPGLRVLHDPRWGESNFQTYWVELLPEFPLDREGLLQHLADHDISARRGIMAAHHHPAYSDRPHAPLPVTDRLAEGTLILPSYHELTAADQARVIDAVRAAASRAAA